MNWTEWIWVSVGLAGQACFTMRFLWQWIVSERRKESVIPVGFWYLSLVGGLMLTVYAVYCDPVLVPGQAAGVVIYVRNLILIRRARLAQARSQPPQLLAAPSDRREAA